MRTFALAASFIAAASTAAFAQSASTPPAQGAQLAYFQTRTLFHSGLRDTHNVALTFDDGPNYRTPAVLDVLKAVNVKPTFFIVGKRARTYPQVLARIASEGHLLANHR